MKLFYNKSILVFGNSLIPPPFPHPTRDLARLENNVDTPSRNLSPTQMVTELMKSLSNKKSKKSQSVIEFMIIFGAIVFFFTAFMLVIQGNVNEKNVEKKEVLASEIALTVQNEIALASRASDGYSREFNVPMTLLDQDYEVSIIENRIYVNSSKIGVSYSVFNVTGNVKKGVNSIEKSGGIVYLNV